MKHLLANMMALLKIKRVSTLIIIFTLIASVTVGAVTIYASQVGNFIVKIEDKNDLEVYISETPDFATPSSRLMADAFEDMTNTTLSNIDIDTIKKQDGSFNDARTYLAYNFYIKNYSTSVVNYNISLIINKTYKGLDEAVRVLVLTDQVNQKVYAKPANIGDADMPLGYPPMIDFYSPAVVFNYDVNNFRREQVTKYTIVMWLEGYDTQCVDDIRGGSIKMELKFRAF